jgi:ureidoglycolate dehydrogenase (NAD+)
MTARVTPEALRGFLAAIFSKAGMPAERAEATAEMLVWAEARGVASHGLQRVPRYLEMIQEGVMDPNASPVLTHLAPALVHIDGKRCPGAVVMRLATDTVQATSRSQGVAMAIVVNTTHAGAIGMHAARIARAGQAGVVATAGMPNMAYHGARVPSLATAPLAIGLPGPVGEAPLLLDMASAALAMGKLRQYREAGQPLPEDWALDANGQATTDPARAAIPLPVGGAKGSGLALTLECLTGVLGGVPALANFLEGADRRHTQSALAIAIDIETIRPLAEVRAEIARLARDIRALPRRDGVDELLLPGERGARMAARREAEGIPTGGSAWNEVVQAAARLGVPTP